MNLKRTLIAVGAAAAVMLAACGGDKKATPTSAPTDAPAGTATTAPRAAATDTTSSDASAKTLGGIFSTLFSSGALGGSAGSGDTDFGADGLTPGDPSLEKYLLTADDLPDGFTIQETTSVRVPDGISKAGGGDVAMVIAAKGDPQAQDPRGAVMLMSMVMKFDDLQALGDALKGAQGLTEQQIQDAVTSGAGDFNGASLANIHVLDSSGLGDGGFAMSMSLDLSGFLKALQDAFAGADATPDPALEDFVLNMKMYVFGRGDLGAGVISMSFGSGAQAGVDELALAKVVDEKLKAGSSRDRR